jgi:hypothetical protein
VSDERRVFQRLNLTKPLDGWFGDWPVQLVDVSASGAQVAHDDDDIPMGARALLRFFWRREEIELTAETVRAEDGRYGLRFLDGQGDIQRLISESVVELLIAQEANASGQREANVIGDATLTSASERFASTYVVWRYDGRVWRRQASLLRDQPEDGFTVSAAEPEDQVELLCRTYESGDAEAQRLTRLLAELSVAASR